MVLAFYNCLTFVLLFSMLYAVYGVFTCRLLMEKIFNLIAVFVSVAFWLILYGFEFLPLVILLLYVGAISVLFLFVVIIINPDFSSGSNVQEEEKFDSLHLFTKMMESQVLFWHLVTVSKIKGYLVTDLEQSLVLDGRMPDIEKNENNFSFLNKVNLVLFCFGIVALFTVIIQQQILVVNFFVKSHYFPFLFDTYDLFHDFLYPWKFVILLNHVELLAMKDFFIPICCSEMAFSDLNWFFSSNYFMFYFINDNFPFLKISGNLDIIFIGQILYTYFGGSLLIVGLILLVSILGVIILTMRQKVKLKYQNTNLQFFRYR